MTKIMTTGRTLALVAALAATGTAGIAIAQPGQRADKDVTRADVETRTAKAFQRMDANGDGKLDQADREAMRARMFDRMDADGNGSISRAEFDAAHQNRRAMRGQRADNGPADGTRMGRHHRGGHHGMRGMGVMKRADANNDGAVSQAEFTAARLARFERMDADGNGTVTVAERKAAREKMRALRKDRRTAADAG